MTANGTKVVEDPDAERDDRRDVELDSELVAEVGQPGGQGRVRQQAAEENARLEGTRDVGLERAEDGVERRQQRDRRIACVGDRNRQGRHQAEQNAQQREQDRDDYYLHYPHQKAPRTRRLRLESAGAPVRGFAMSWRGPLICTRVPAKARAGPPQATATAVDGICSPRPVPRGSSR